MTRKALSELPRKRTVLLLRAVLALSVGALAFTAPLDADAGPAQALAAGFFVTLALLAPVPGSLFESIRFDLGLLLADTLFLTAAVFYSTPVRSGMIVAFFGVVLLVAVGGDLLRSVVSATAATLLIVWFTAASGQDGLSAGFFLRVPFFYAVALYYAFFVGRSAERERESALDRAERDQLRTIVEVMESTSTSLEPHRVIYDITQRISRHVNSNRCSILLGGPGRRPRGAHVLASSDDPAMEMFPISLIRYPELQRVLATGRAAIVANVLKDPIMASVRAQLRNVGFRSLLAIPMFRPRDRAHRLILRIAGHRPFTTAEIDFASVVAAASTNALRNALDHWTATRPASLADALSPGVPASESA